MDVVLVLWLVFAVIAALIAATLIVPVDISIRLIKEGKLPQGLITFGLLKGAAAGRVEFSPEKREFRLSVLGATLLRRPLEKRGDKPKKEQHIDWNKIVWNADELYAAGKELAGALTRNLSIKRLGGRVKVGLPDPSQTGILTGFLYAGCGIASAVLPETQLEIEPSFEKEQLDADLELELSLPLFKLIRPVIRFFRSTRRIF